MGMIEAPLIPAPPEHHGCEWSSSLERYSFGLEALARKMYTASLGEHYKIRDAYRHAADIIEDTRISRDAEMLLAYADWLFKVERLTAVRSTVEVLRKHHEGPVRHLVTEYNISACDLICEAIKNRGGTDWEENRECAYLAFGDPAMLEKVLVAAESGVRGRVKILEHIEMTHGIAVPLMKGAL
jgi:hypothetical protein